LHAVYYLGPGVESALVRASDTGIYWFLSVARELVPSGMTDPVAVLAHLSPKFDATFRAVTSATKDLRFDELVDRDPIPFWSKAVVTLLGDAAHPLLPQTGQGAAQAIVDGVTLGAKLRGDVDVVEALRSYERERMGPTTKLLRQGRRTARVMKTTHPVACYVRDVVVRMIPVTTMARLFLAIKRGSGSNPGAAST
jgi:2-polyprenyl-6-methoxyphenol hydroxylase-like FAD-dependent oxidoreductase